MGAPASNPTLARAAAVKIVETLARAGHVAYFAGGCVRDELLGLTPSDYDVATDATPQRVRALFPHTREVGAHFGVMHVHVDSCVVEVATFRADAAYSDKRRPDSVRFSDANEDAARRDFTVNALFLDPLARAAPADAAARSPRGGTIIDLVRGIPDLHARVLRAVGDPEQRLAEDHLRALRAVRLAAKLGFEIEPGTARAIRAHATELAGISRERVGDELRRMLSHATRAVAVSLLHELSLDGPVLSEQALGPSEALALRALPPEASFPLALAAWALDRGLDLPGTPHAPLVSRWRSALCLSNDESEALRDILRDVGIIRSDWFTRSIASQKRTGASAWFEAAIELVGARDPGHAAAVRERLGILRATPSGLAPLPVLVGDDLIAMGAKPGPLFKAVLDAVYDAQLEDRVSNKGQARELARTLGV